MATLVDYLYWRGDLTFYDSPFNEIDAMILSQIAYYPWNDTVPERFDDTPVPLYEAIPEIQWEGESIAYKEFLMDIAPTIAKSKRYGDIKAIGFVDEVEAESQFCAITFILSEDAVFVAFRGTDNTIAGWRENMDLAYEEQVPAQKKSVNYLYGVGNEFDHNIILGGHSKGGNLAVYSASNCVKVFGDRIIKVFNFDGPGFNETVMEKINFNRISDKVRTFVPQDSLIGMLLDHKEPYIVIRSKEKGGAHQHYMISWLVGPKKIVREKSLSTMGSISSDSISAWIKGMSEAEKREFIDILFGLVDNEGICTVDELMDRKNLMALVTEYNKLAKTKKLAVQGPINALGSSFIDRVFEPIADIASETKDKVAISAYKAVEKMGGKASELAEEYRNYLDSTDNN